MSEYFVYKKKYKIQKRKEKQLYKTKLRDTLRLPCSCILLISTHMVLIIYKEKK